jgi:hypothetical protein
LWSYSIKFISKDAPDLIGPGGVCREVLAFQAIEKHPNIVECTEIFEDEKSHNFLGATGDEDVPVGSRSVVNRSCFGIA